MESMFDGAGADGWDLWRDCRKRLGRKMAEKKASTGGRKRRATPEAVDTDPGQPVPGVTEVSNRSGKPLKRVAKVMLYTHPKVAEKIKEIALHWDRKANDVYLDAIDLYLAKAGHRGIKHVIDD